MNYIIIFCGLLISKFLSAQSNPILTNQLNLSFGKSKHFSGDIPGIVFTTEYSKKIKKLLSYSIGLSGTIHDGEDRLFFNAPVNGELINGSIRYVTSGVQIAGHLGYHFINTKRSDLQFKLGPLIRYQSSSLANVTTVIYPIVTGLPIPVIYFGHYEPQKMLMVGGSMQLRYDYTINRKITLGIFGGFQIDSNEDNIAQVSLSVGRRF
jgi:hypothetical protein